MTRLTSGLVRGVRFGAWGAAGGACGSVLGEMLRQHERATLLRVLVETSLWFGVIAACVAVAILLGYEHYWQGQWPKKRLRGVATGGLFGALAGAIAGGVAQFVFSVGGSSEPLRVFCWGIAGGLLGLGLSFRIPNLGRWRGAAGGLVGGLLGGILFVFLGSIAAQALGRLIGVAAIGFFIGLMIMLVEAVLSEAWLEIAYGPRESRTVGLGSEPVCLGSDAEACLIYVANTPPVALRYTLRDGQVICEDMDAGGRSQEVQPGDRRTVGNLTVTVCGSAQDVTIPTALLETGPRGEGPSTLQGLLSLRLASGAVVPLQVGLRVTAAQIPGLVGTEPGGVVAEVTTHPRDPSTLGLKNLTGQTWNVRLPNGEATVVPPGRNVKVAAGTAIDFGPTSGEITA